MQWISNFLLTLQKFFLPRQKLINKILLGITITLMAFWATMLYGSLFASWRVIPLMKGVGSKLSIVALGLFCLTLLPGIIKRLNLWPKLTLPIATLITPFRRQLGIMMFLTAFVHMSFSTTLPYLTLQLQFVKTVLPLTLADKLQLLPSFLPPPFRLFEIIALIGWLILLPVWLTSNDLSQKYLGKWWKRLQRLTYVAVWFIFLHIALQGEGWALAAGGIVLLEVLSWMVFWWRKHQTKSTSPEKVTSSSPVSAVE